MVKYTLFELIIINFTCAVKVGQENIYVLNTFLLLISWNLLDKITFLFSFVWNYLIALSTKKIGIFSHL